MSHLDALSNTQGLKFTRKAVGGTAARAGVLLVLLGELAQAVVDVLDLIDGVRAAEHAALEQTPGGVVVVSLGVVLREPPERVAGVDVGIAVAVGHGGLLAKCVDGVYHGIGRSRAG